MLGTLLSEWGKRFESMEKRMELRLEKFEEKLDVLVSHGNEVATLKTEVQNLKIQAAEIPKLQLEVNSLKTQNKVLTAVLTVMGAPLVLFLLYMLINRAAG